MNININQDGEKTVVGLSGRLDAIASPRLQEKLIPLFNDSEHVELDFAELIYVSSAGLRVLLMGEKTAKQRSSKQTVVNVSPEIMEVFEMTGFSNVLNIL